MVMLLDKKHDPVMWGEVVCVCTCVLKTIQLQSVVQFSCN